MKFIKNCQKIIKSLALFLSKYLHSVISSFESKSIKSGFPVGISSKDILLLSSLNKNLHKALIEFPWAEIKIFLLSNNLF